MAQAENTAVVLFQAAPAASVGEDCTHVSLWSALTGGDFLQSQSISTNPSPLALGEQYEIAAGALVLDQAAPTNGTEDMAERAVRGRILGGVWVQAHTGAPGGNGTNNVLPGLARVAIAQAGFTVSQ